MACRVALDEALYLSLARVPEDQQTAVDRMTGGPIQHQFAGGRLQGPPLGVAAAQQQPAPAMQLASCQRQRFELPSRAHRLFAQAHVLVKVRRAPGQQLQVIVSVAVFHQSVVMCRGHMT